MTLEKKKDKRIKYIPFIIFWLILVALCIIYREKISVNNIATWSGNNRYIIVIIILTLFMLKSVTAVIYSTLIYVASGALLPLWLAIPVNIIGVAIMITIPFIAGEKLGKKGMNELMEKYPRLKLIKINDKKGNMKISFISRALGIIPTEPLSIFMGTTGIPYAQYITGSLLGLAPGVICSTVIGDSISDIHSRKFVVSVAVKILMICISALLIITSEKRKKSI